MADQNTDFTGGESLDDLKIPTRPINETDSYIANIPWVRAYVGAIVASIGGGSGGDANDATNLAYNDKGLPISMVVGGRTWVITYYANGTPQKATRDDGAEKVWVYNDARFPEFYTDLTGNGVASSSGGTVGVTTSISKTSLRRAAALEFDKAALIQANTWVANTATNMGVYRRHSSGHLMVCTATGVSGNTEPTFSSTSLMVDGTNSWAYLGRESTFNKDGYPVPTTGASPFSLVETRLWTNQSKFLLGQCAQLFPVGTDGASGATGYEFFDGTGNMGYLRSISFETDSPQVGLIVTNSSFANPKIIVDGYPVEESPRFFLGGAPSGFTVDWGGVWRQRKYRLDVSAGTIFRGVALNAQATLDRPQLEGPLGVWAGDSYGSTIADYTSVVRPFDYLSERVMRRLGIRYTRNLHRAGVGYSSTASGVRYNAVDNLTNNPPTTAWSAAALVVIAYGFNDVGFDINTTATNARACWERARSQYPTAFIAVVGPWPYVNAFNSDLLTYDIAIQNAHSVWGDPNSAYISPSRYVTGAWITGLGRWGATTGTGNGDFYIGGDALNPSFPGAAYLEERLVSQIDQVMAAKGH